MELESISSRASWQQERYSKCAQQQTLFSSLNSKKHQEPALHIAYYVKVASNNLNTAENCPPLLVITCSQNKPELRSN